MSRRVRSLEEKIKIINDFKEETYSISELESIYNTDNSTIYDWVYKFERYGVEGLKE